MVLQPSLDDDVYALGEALLFLAASPSGDSTIAQDKFINAREESNMRDTYWHRSRSSDKKRAVKWAAQLGSLGGYIAVGSFGIRVFDPAGGDRCEKTSIFR